MMYGVKYTQNGETKMSFMASDNTEEAVEKFKRAMGNIKEKGIEIVNAKEMTEEIKTEEIVAVRGHVYDFIETDGSIKNRVLVVSSNRRMKDNIVSVIMLRNRSYGNEVTDILVEDRGWFVDGCMVTFCRRDRLGKDYGAIKASKLKDITKGIARALDIEVADVNYKELYEDLLDKVMERGA